MISILVPTLGRAGKLAGVSANIHEATASDHEVIFIAEPGDTATHEAVAQLPDRLHVNTHRACYTGAINSAFPDAKGEYIFTAADDVGFHPGWDARVLAVMKDGIQVGGTNDLMNPQVLAGVMATHMLIGRAYIEGPGAALDEPPGTVMFEGYGHHYGESELVSLAIHRGVFAPCLDSVVEHVHWSRTGERDATTGLNEAREAQDHDLCFARCSRFTPPSAMASEEAYVAYARQRIASRMPPHHPAQERCPVEDR